MVMALGSLKLPPTGKFEMNEWQGAVSCVIYIHPIDNTVWPYHALSRLLAEFGELLDLRDPDSLNHKEREEQRKEKEELDFNPDHYLSGKTALGDYFLDNTITFQTFMMAIQW